MAVGETERPPAGVPGGAPGAFVPAPDGRPEAVDLRLRDRLRAAVCCLALTALAFATRPGAILADTKIDMAVNPLGFLGRALHLWDTEQFGQLQNQAVGYLFPMGPFYALGDLLGVPAWITQRCWLALLMCLAFLGARRLAARLGVGGPAARLTGAMAYALAPNALATMGQLSSEYMPAAMLPWIVLPLVTAAEGGGGRARAAARSGIAIACCGGINATATVAVLVVPVLYLLTRRWSLAQARLPAWWTAAVAAATAWWLIPLLLTGTYGFSWLTYTEKARTTTGPTGLINVLRGAERWVNYLVVDGQVWWPVGHAVSLDPVPVICTGVVAALGLAGLVARPLPERSFLLLTLLSGLAIISMGHLGGLPGPFAAELRDLLDGPLAPLRNLHKFDAVVRLPLALGLAHLLTVAAAATAARANGPGRRPERRQRVRAIVSVPVAAAVALGGIGVTAVSKGLSGPGEFAQVPRYWKDAASWLNTRAGQQGVLALPGAAFGEYLWGRPMDDIVQPLLTARWAVRQLVPAGSPGYTRALDAVDQQVRTGQSSPGLADFLGRMGIRYLLVRNDLRRETLRGGWPARLHQALDASPGLRKAAAFGAPVGGDLTDDAVSAVDQPYPALEVYEVEGAQAVAGLADADDPVRVYGGPEALLPMADGKALPRGPVLLNDDAPDLGGSPVVTDSPRLLRRDFGELHQTSQTLTAAERNSAGDVLDDGWLKYATTAVYGGGVRDVVASSSAGGDRAIPQARKPGAVPYAAVDGDPFSAWETGGWDGPLGQWLRVDFDRAREVPRLTARFVQDRRLGPPVARVAVETERGAVEQPVRATGDAQPLRTAPGATRWLRLRIIGMAGGGGSAPIRAGVSELAIEGVRPSRTYALPVPDGAAGTPSYVMSRAPGATPDCMKGARRWVCSETLGGADEEGRGFDRTFTAGRATRARLTGTAVLTDPRLVARYTTLPGDVRVAASTALSAHPADQARSAFDGDRRTSWIAAANDGAPTLTLGWRRGTRVSSLTLDRPPGASGPVQVRVEGRGGQTREGLPDARGRITFAPLDTDRLTLTFRRGGRLQPFQISEVRVPGVRPLRDAGAAPLSLDCGFGPRLRVGGPDGVVETKVTGTLGDLLEGRPVAFEACRRVPLQAGPNRLASVPLDSFRVETVVVGDRATPDGALRPVRVLRWSAGKRELQVDAGRRSFLTVNENYNTGWQARAGGKTLRPVRLDGWKQGWLVPAGTGGTVELTYRPDAAQRIDVVAGLSLLLMLLLIGMWPGGRRGEPPEVVARGWPAWAAIGLAAVLGFWVAGVPGLAVTAATAVFCGWARTRRTRLLRAPASPWTIAVLMLAGTGCLAVGYWTKTLDNPAAPSGYLGDVVPQVLGLVIMGRVALELWRAPAPIELSWARGGGGLPGPGAAPDAPPDDDSPSPLRWTPRAAAEDRSPRPPGKPGPSTRTSRR
ncbi:alpha-(1-_3)-arabinofuranosyltransferase family protein [Actinomadura vinacea]|uniref:Alpha-(1->3)-arabinofuranosyltransferase family protein n=1 Tax=Actinomadura vinacea TaxID=115336 RepID=A0ABP5WCA5_9ACTN